MIVGTAGHIDHGKTTLVRALTGVDTDRLPEEKRRGITIDLGFAPLELDGIGTVGVVDVPGHEAFVRTMVAGTSGVDIALLVIASDEGMMPQTREHLSVLSLLGVSKGVVALTKADLAEPEWLMLVEEEIRAALAESPFAQAPLIPVSVARATGLAHLRAALSDAARQVAPRPDDDLFRLPVDRAFTVRGTGTVVTGTVWSGALERDEMVRVMPGNLVARVRALQAHGQVVSRVSAGDRAAIALASVALEQVRRGTTLVSGEGWGTTRVVRAEVTLLSDAPRALGPRTRVRLHLGTQDVGARIVVRDGKLMPGRGRPARVILDGPLVTRAGDRFVLRAESPVATIGGGIVSDPMASPRARHWDRSPSTPAARLARVLSDAGQHGIRHDSLAVRIGVRPREIDALLATQTPWRVGGLVIDDSACAALAATASAELRAFHRSHPLEPGAPIQWLRSRLSAPEEVCAALTDRLSRDGSIILEQGLARDPSFVLRISEAQSFIRDAMVSMIAAAGAEPPTLDELALALGVNADQLVAIGHHLIREGVLVAVEPTRLYAQSVVDELLGRLRQAMTPGSAYGPGDLRPALGVSRKFLIPFLEYSDRVGETVRGPAGLRRMGKSKAGTA